MNNNMYALRSALSDSLSIKEDSSVMKELFTRYVSPQELLNACPEELTSIKGIGLKTAKQITSALKLARVINTPSTEGYKITCPDSAFQLMRHEIGALMHEEFWIVCCNTKNIVLAKERISVGSLNAAIVHPREVFRRAIIRGSASILACHNHPSFNVDPSHEDKQLTQRLAHAAEVVGIEMLDHIIVSPHSYFSFKEHGLL